MLETGFQTIENELVDNVPSTTARPVGTAKSVSRVETVCTTRTESIPMRPSPDAFWKEMVKGPGTEISYGPNEKPSLVGNGFVPAVSTAFVRMTV